MVGTRVTAVLLAAGMIFAGCNHKTMKTRETTMDVDRDFLVKASETNASEIAAGQLAVKQGSSSQIREYWPKSVLTSARSNSCAAIHGGNCPRSTSTSTRVHSQTNISPSRLG
jgi:predicted outer membrane protein